MRPEIKTPMNTIIRVTNILLQTTLHQEQTASIRTDHKRIKKCFTK
ncbi:MAG: hypothetical protein ACI9Q9_001243 [Flavobacterium sp.]|jgi:hypothetical protein